jgi:PAS domain
MPDPAEKLNAMSIRNDWTMRADMELKFDAPELNALREVWSEKAKAAGGLPARADFDARTLKPFLRHVSIIERAMHPSGRMSYRFRFYGSELTHRFGEQTGQFVEMSIPPDRLKRWMAAYDAVLDAGAPMRFLSYFEIPRVSFLNGESFSAPLANDGRKPNTILACTYFTPKVYAEAQSA